jgi:uncharacterized repeat protein (TIGR03803 family)
MLARPQAAAHGYKVLFSFSQNEHALFGEDPQASLIAVNGILYGTTKYGGAHQDGTVFGIRTSGKQTVLHSFQSSDGGAPKAPLLEINGTLYGATSNGGSFGGGTVFSLGTNGSNFRILYNFGHGKDGLQPSSALIVKNGKLYGTTLIGGKYNDGTVFSVDLTSGKGRSIYSFAGYSDGMYPTGGLRAVGGSFYGTTSQGGASGLGTIFQLTTGGHKAILYNFGGTDGSHPNASLTLLRGTLYGTTEQGGAFGGGTVFSIAPNGSNERVVHSFGIAPDGLAPESEVLAIKGRLYGTTSYGGSMNFGTIFEMSTSGKESILHNFMQGDRSDGESPFGGLIDLNGALYGTTQEGGSADPTCTDSGYDCDYGTVYALPSQ